MDPTNRKRHHHHHYELEHQQMKANGEVNNGINYLPTSANGNNHNNIEELRRWKMAALEAENGMLKSKLENHGLKAEIIGLKGETRALKVKEAKREEEQAVKEAKQEAEQAVQIANIEKLSEFLQKMMYLQEQNRLEISTLKEENCAIWKRLKEQNCTIWEKLKEAEHKEEQQRKEIAEQKVLNQAGTKALRRQLKETEEKLEANIQNNLAEYTKRMEHKHEKEIANLKYNLMECIKRRMADLEQKQERENAELKNYLGQFTKRMASLEQKHEMESADLKVENMQLEANIQHNLSDFTKKMASLEEKQEKKIAHLTHNLVEFTKRMEQKHEKEIADLKVENVQLSQNTQIDEQMRELGKKLALLDGHQKDTIRWSQIKSTILWPFLVKDRRLLNPKANVWNPEKTKAQISPDGLGAISSKTSNDVWHNVFAAKRFGISAAQCRQDFYPGTILYYFEVTRMSSSNWAFYIGLSNGHVHDNLLVCKAPNCYCFPTRVDHCYLAGTQHHFEWPTDAIKPQWNGIGDTLGCGILLNPKNELAIFFTANGMLMGKQIPLTLPNLCDSLTPIVSIKDVSVEANFGHDLATKPFKYDIEKWPGLVFQPCTNI